MAASTLVALADLKVLLDEVTGSGQDALLNQIIAQVSQRFEGETRRTLLTTVYTAEVYDGNGLPSLQVRQWPVSAVAGATIEDETAPDTTDDDIFRFYPDGRLLLLGRTWTAPRSGAINNVTVTYTAGHASIAAFKDTDGMPDAHAMLTDACVRIYRDLKQAKGGRIASQSHMGGSITYASTELFSSDWYKQNWKPLVNKYQRWRI